MQGVESGKRKGRGYRELCGIWDGFGNECAGLVDGVEGTNRRQTTREDQEDRRGTRVLRKIEETGEQDNKKHKGYGQEQIFYSSVYKIVLIM